MASVPTSTITLTGLGTFNRLGFGAMRIVGYGVWGEPADRVGAITVARRAVELGVNFIDTADSYGPEVSEAILAEALHPYPDGLRIATKAGFTRHGPNIWVMCGRPEYLRQQCLLSIRRLKVEALDLFQLHRIDPSVPAEEQFGVMRDLLDEGKVRSLGLSECSVADIKAAQTHFPVTSVQNRYNLTDQRSSDVLDFCTAEGIAFIPWAPVSAGELARPGGPVDEVAKRERLTHSQVALAWLLQKSPMILPIPGTSSVAHLEENMAAAGACLSEESVLALDAIG